ncbi:MAG: YqgE/AlgH family protein [Burkholderiales bacterium]|nr:YqgE/AlgH family protein [Burkholderiales bacterium]
MFPRPSAAWVTALAGLAAAILAAVPGLSAAADVASGIFLVAKREMRDPRFRETVVLVTQPREGSPFGVIVNRPLERSVSDAFPEEPRLAGRRERLHFGGPVAPHGLIVLVRTAKPPERAVQVLSGVYFTADKDWIGRLFRRPDPLRGVRVFVGYSGWGPGQLQNELRRGDWHVLPADAETIFELDAGRIWHELARRATAQAT